LFPNSRHRTHVHLPVVRRLWVYLLRCLPLVYHDADPKDVCGKFVDGFRWGVCVTWESGWG
jgi:hypothetical protein